LHIHGVIGLVWSGLDVNMCWLDRGGSLLFTASALQRRWAPRRALRATHAAAPRTAREAGRNDAESDMSGK